MTIEPTPLGGLFVIEQDRVADERGYFARTFDSAELFAVTQMSASYNERAATLRGLHYQADPHGESKLVRCTRGAIFDVAVDLRAGSPTRHAWYGTELTADNGRGLLIPAGFAHGFLTLEGASEVLYAMDVAHVPDAARGVRWDDPAFDIAWPARPEVISERDASYPDLRE